MSGCGPAVQVELNDYAPRFDPIPNVQKIMFIKWPNFLASHLVGCHYVMLGTIETTWDFEKWNYWDPIPPKIEDSFTRKARAMGGDAVQMYRVKKDMKRGKGHKEFWRFVGKVSRTTEPGCRPLYAIYGGGEIVVPFRSLGSVGTLPLAGYVGGTGFDNYDDKSEVALADSARALGANAVRLTRNDQTVTGEAILLLDEDWGQ